MVNEIPLLLSRSNTSTLINKTGFWRYVRPEFVQNTAPCSASCPAGEDVARIEKLVRQEYFKRALETILIENPFPSVCGRVCFHPCENVCNRKEFDEEVGIHCIERFLGDAAIRDRLSPVTLRLPPNHKKIAVVGAGPAGLSAAYFMTLLGYSCDVFESRSLPGGILRWGIPSHRLPVDVLDSEINRIERMGIRLHCGKPVTEALLQHLQHDFHGVFVGCGLGRSLKMKIPGEEFALDGLKFLSDVKKGIPLFIENSMNEDPVVVIGGGNTAVDVSRTLVRMGIDTIMVYRRRREDMPAFNEEIRMAMADGVVLKELLAPVCIEKEDLKYRVTLQKMQVPDKKINGRMRVVPRAPESESSTESMLELIKARHVITAIGAEISEPWYIPSAEDRSLIRLTHCTLTFGKTPVAYGGDLTNTTKSVADAVASGKQAAIAIDMMLSEGIDDVKEKFELYQVGNGPSLSMEIYIGGERKERNSNIVRFDDINLCYFHHEKRIVPETEEGAYSQNEALKESHRCFNCGICNDCDNCWLFCPEIAVIKDNSSNRRIDTDYCKGCGICVEECPRCAMVLKEEM